jgi:hypothetical protein
MTNGIPRVTRGEGARVVSVMQLGESSSKVETTIRLRTQLNRHGFSKGKWKDNLSDKRDPQPKKMEFATLETLLFLRVAFCCPYIGLTPLLSSQFLAESVKSFECLSFSVLGFAFFHWFDPVDTK